MITIKKKKKYISRNRNITSKNNVTNIIVVLLVIVMIIIGEVFIKLGIKERKNITPLYTYEAQKSDNYEILLKPNNFYLTKNLPEGLYYASKSIDNININFGYYFKANDKANIKYNYFITADLIGKVNAVDKKIMEVWNRRFDLTNNNENYENDIQEISFNQDVNIDYETYSDLVNSFEQTYGITIEATLKVRLNVILNIDVPNFNIEPKTVEDYIELEIPINSTVTEVKRNYENVTTDNIIPSTQNINAKEIIYYLLAILFLCGAITLIMKIIKEIINNKALQDNYEKNINRILKYYGDIIVTVNDEPDFTNSQIMNVQNFGDLIDVAEQNKKNIIHYEVLEKEESNLYVVIDKYVYKYVVTTDKLI